MITAKLQGKPVISATVCRRSKLKARVGQRRTVQAEVQGIRPDTLPAEYTGAYDVTPATAQQELETDGKRMAGNVTVQAIPYYEVSNPQNGKTIIIGA